MRSQFPDDVVNEVKGGLTYEKNRSFVLKRTNGKKTTEIFTETAARIISSAVLSRVSPLHESLQRCVSGARIIFENSYSRILLKLLKMVEMTRKCFVLILSCFSNVRAPFVHDLIILEEFSIYKYIFYNYVFYIFNVCTVLINQDFLSFASEHLIGKSYVQIDYIDELYRSHFLK